VTVHEWLAVAAVLAGLLGGLPVLNKLCRSCSASPEVSRKAVHVAMGATCACFPWIFFRPLPVWILAALAVLPLLLLRLIPALRQGVGSGLHGVKRLSYGEILFAPAVALVFQISRHDPLLYVIPVNILTVADAAGAIAGTRWGSRHYVCGTGKKSVEGSIAFLFVAFFCCFLPLWFTQRFDPFHTIGISLILAILAMMAEGISDRGFDNLVIPLGCHFLLGRLLTSDTTWLVVRFVAATFMLVVVITGSRWSSLTGSALIGAALLGYGCAILADWRLLLPLLAVFLQHLFTTRRHQLKEVFDHRLDVVIAHAIASLPWALSVERQWLPPLTALAGISFSMAVLLALMDTATQIHVHGRAIIGRATAKGWLVAALPGLVWLWQDARRLALPLTISILITPILCYFLQRFDRRHEVTSISLWMLKGAVALLAATPALLLR
jgi:phytol kinase